MTTTCLITGGDQGVCAGVLHLALEHNVPCAFFLPHDDARADQNRLEVGFVPHLLHPHLVTPGQYPATDGRFLEGDTLKRGRIVCPSSPVCNLAAEMCPDYDHLPTTVRHTLDRDAQMVVEADAVYLLGYLIRPTSYSLEPMGGCGWLQQMAIRKQKPLYFYDLQIDTWLKYDYTRMQFAPWFGGRPCLANQHSLVAGTRRLKRHEPAYFDILRELVCSAVET